MLIYRADPGVVGSVHSILRLIGPLGARAEFKSKEVFKGLGKAADRLQGL